ncbi:tyrosine-protein kinase SRK2 [Biomphalaria glabrata]|uniref:Tyrosine-protein kinase n=1 Tax=Biomphalaria glabrata TaxID=6526 RepID=A0A9W3AAN1_BIOGL|nr:tyrosine-protein kinase SRK2-like [Biomphalaria glabrata]XP_055884363.1 tyrosine-protein kinase SRK2-like [Biomphalaria glabrata]XP_055884364.1 tyrosine-protein kinase SRK2-like [Biomphalaria glabrata]XP_055884365.1 tyrosine-protein kinase SRK2-like [Biomphalaria glabrata]KAI8754405.1 tyrosine-protein kinase SRK2-like [Biomphalaria glabrata]KAI8774249.1 tyrosine-protein kinase SRK2 [Biomphalaria glabrata]
MGNVCPVGGGRQKKENGAKYLPDPNPSVHISSPHTDDQHPHSGGSGDHHIRPLPIPPPAKNRVRALYNFEAINEDDLSFKKGDLMEVEDLSESNDWWLATHTKSGKKGYIPSNYVIKDDTSPQTQDWWFEFDRKESDKMLLLPGNPQGTFLVREATDKSSYVLSVRDSDKANGDPCVKHYRIRKMDEGGYYISAKKIFKSLFDVINYYKENSDGLCCRLALACPRIRPVVHFRDLELPRDAVKLTHKLGAGCFGEVWKGTMRKVVDVAVKTLKPGTMSAEAFLNEAKIMHKLTHSKLVQLLAVVSATEPFYIITELMVNGALLDFLRSDQGKKLKFTTLIEMNSQIAEGMTYLESVNFVHRDLRAANILVGEHYDVKVADFGLARILEADDIYEANENAKFPIKWTAPEAALERKFSIKSDVWSFGVLMYEIITYGKVPYPGMAGSEVLQMVEKGRRMSKPTNGPIEVPDSYFNMMMKCWHRQPEERPTFESLHNFFDDYFVNVEPSYRDMDEL